jgi:ornithine carbamoyltransferase
MTTSAIASLPVLAAKDLLRIADLTHDDIVHLLDEAARFRAHPFRATPLLTGDTVVCYFAKPSTRTRISFETAIARLGGIPVSVGPAELQLGRGETIADTARVLSRYSRAVVIRTFADSDVADLAANATIPVVNALTDGHHPCQALADMLTLRDRFGGTTGLRIAYVGDGNNVAHSLMEACALMGMHLTVATPPGYEPDPAVVCVAEDLAAANGSTIVLTHDPFEAAEDVHAVYTDVWVSMGDAAEEREARMHALRPYQVNGDLFARALPDAVFMHCLPAHRGEEITSAVMDGPRSIIWDQSENRLHVQKALLVEVLAG